MTSSAHARMRAWSSKILSSRPESAPKVLHHRSPCRRQLMDPSSSSEVCSSTCGGRRLHGARVPNAMSTGQSLDCSECCANSQQPRNQFSTSGGAPRMRKRLARKPNSTSTSSSTVDCTRRGPTAWCGSSSGAVSCSVRLRILMNDQPRIDQCGDERFDVRARAFGNDLKR